MAAPKKTVQTAIDKEKEERALKKALEDIAAAEKREKEQQAKGVDASLFGCLSSEDLAKARALEENFARKKEEELAKQRAIEADLDKRNMEAAIQASLKASLASAFPPTATAAPITITIQSSAASSITISPSATAVDSKSNDELANMRALQDKLNAEEKRKRLANEEDKSRALIFSQKINTLASDASLAQAVDLVENAQYYARTAEEAIQCSAAEALWDSKMPKWDPKGADDKKYSEELKRAQAYKAAAIALLTEVRHHASVIGEPKEVTSDLENLQNEMHALIEQQYKQNNRSSTDTKLQAEERKKIEEQFAKNTAEHKAKLASVKLTIDAIRNQKNINLETAVDNEKILYQSWVLAKANAKSSMSQMLETFSAELKKFSEGKIEAFVLLGKDLKIPVKKDLSICAHKSSAFIKSKMGEFLKLDAYFAGSDPRVALYDSTLTIEKVSAEMNAFIKEQFEGYSGYKTDPKLAADHQTQSVNIASSFAKVAAARGFDNETGTHVEQFISRCWTLAKKMGLDEKTIIASHFSGNTELWKNGIKGGCIPGIVNRLWSFFVISLTTLLAPQLNTPPCKNKVTASTPVLANNAAAGSAPSTAASSATTTSTATAVSTKLNK